MSENFLLGSTLFLALFGGIIIGVSASYNFCSKNALIEKCQETNGKYDFCKEVKQWGLND